MAQRRRQLVPRARERVRPAAAGRRQDVRHADGAELVERDLLVRPGGGPHDLDERPEPDVARDRIADAVFSSIAAAGCSGVVDATSCPLTPSPKRSHTAPSSSASAVKCRS